MRAVCCVCESWWCWCSFVCVSIYLRIFEYKYLFVWSVCVKRCIGMSLSLSVSLCLLSMLLSLCFSLCLCVYNVEFTRRCVLLCMYVCVFMQKYVHVNVCVYYGACWRVVVVVEWSAVGLRVLVAVVVVVAVFLVKKT